MLIASQESFVQEQREKGTWIRDHATIAMHHPSNQFLFHSSTRLVLCLDPENWRSLSRVDNADVLAALMASVGISCCSCAMDVDETNGDGIDGEDKSEDEYDTNVVEGS